MSKNKWGALSMRDRAFLIREAVRNGITDINSIRETWEHRFDGLQDVAEKVNTSNADFARRLRQQGRTSIPDWEDPRRIATHKLGVATDENGIHYIYPDVQNIDNRLVDYSNPSNPHYNHGPQIAAERGDTIQIGNTNRDLRNAINFTKQYKKLGLYPEFSASPHTFDGESDQPSEEKPWYKKLASAISEGSRMARDARIGAVGAEPIRQLYREGKTEEAQELAKQYAKANIAGMTMAAGAANTAGLAGDLAITGVSTLADTAVEGNTENLGKDLGTNLAFDLAGGVLQWLPKALKGGKQVVKNIKSLNEDFIVRPSVPKIKAMHDHSSKWYNFPNGYEFHFATATPKKYMGELFYAPALEKATAKTAEINKTSLLDMIKGGQRPQYETTHLQLDGKTLDDILDEPASLYISSSPTGIGGYDGIKGSNIDLSHPSLPAHTSTVHEKKHAVQRATNAGKADVTQYALGDYRLFPESEALKSGYHKILSDQADFLKELDTGLPADSADTVTELIFKTNESRNIRELNATVAESLYKMFKNRLPYPDKRFMTKEMLDLYKTEIAQMTSEEFIKEFSRGANAYAEDYIRGIEAIKKKDPARAEYLTKRLKDLVINQYF